MIISGNARITPVIAWARFDLMAKISANKMAVKKMSSSILVETQCSRKDGKISVNRIRTSSMKNGAEN